MKPAVAILLEEIEWLREKVNSLREYCHKKDYDIYDWEIKNIEGEKV